MIQILVIINSCNSDTTEEMLPLISRIDDEDSSIDSIGTEECFKHPGPQGFFLKTCQIIRKPTAKKTKKYRRGAELLWDYS